MSVTNLPFLQQQIIRYGMTLYLALGVVGNIFSCILFMQTLYRRTPSSIYFCSLSIVATMHLVWSVAPFIYTLNHIDPQIQSLFYCKVRLYGSHVFGLCIRYIVVLACVDRYFVTRMDVRMRALSSPQIAIKFIFVICIACFVVGIHIPIFMDIRGNVCGMFGLYKLIYAIYLITLFSILPTMLMIIFSTFALHSFHRRHTNQIHARERDRDFLGMVIAVAMVSIFTSIPYSANLIYDAITYNIADKSPQRLETETFIFFVTQFLIYFISVTPFYIFILTSKPFRNEFINIFVKCWNKYVLRRVRIIPINDQNVTVIFNARVITGTNETIL